MGFINFNLSRYRKIFLISFLFVLSLVIGEIFLLYRLKGELMPNVANKRGIDKVDKVDETSLPEPVLISNPITLIGKVIDVSYPAFSLSITASNDPSLIGKKLFFKIDKDRTKIYFSSEILAFEKKYRSISEFLNNSTKLMVKLKNFESLNTNEVIVPDEISFSLK